MASPAPALPQPIRSFQPRLPFVLASDRDILVGRGVAQVVATSLQAGPADAARAFFREAGSAGFPYSHPPVLVGALPFDPGRPAHLYQPEQLCRVGSYADAGLVMPSIATHERGGRWRIEADPSRAGYAAAVARALGRLGSGADDLRKVVLARSLVLHADRPIDLSRLFARLAHDRSATTFLVPLPDDDGRDGVLIGASPELLVAKTGAAVVSHPLAGSARRSADPVEDRAAAAGLERSDKDRREHAAVVEWVVTRLEPFCRRLSVPSGPSLVSTETMWHLGTRIEGTLRDGAVSSLELAAALHPTPAVCGQPFAAAARAIAELEPFDRGYFGGAVGWCDASGDGRWLVAIRCAEVRDTVARLYAGAGIVAGSDPDAETAETSAKFGALLRALGVDEEGRALALE